MAEQLLPCCTQEVGSPLSLALGLVGEATQPGTPPAGAVQAGVAGGVVVQVWDVVSLVQLGAL